MLIRWATVGLLVSFCLAAAPSQAQLKGENLIVTPPAGFKVGYKGTNNGMNMME